VFFVYIPRAKNPYTISFPCVRAYKRHGTYGTTNVFNCLSCFETWNRHGTDVEHGIDPPNYSPRRNLQTKSLPSLSRYRSHPSVRRQRPTALLVRLGPLVLGLLHALTQHFLNAGVHPDPEPPLNQALPGIGVIARLLLIYRILDHVRIFKPPAHARAVLV